MRCSQTLLLVIAPLLLAGQARSEDSAFAPISRDTPYVSQDRFRAYGDNHALLQWTRNTGWVDHWERDLQGHFSLGYTFRRATHTEFMFTYTGEFDFYVDVKGRPSSPVVNRLNNPAFHYIFLPDFGPGESKNRPLLMDIGLEHESNGQVTSVDGVDPVNGTDNASTAQDNYQRGNRPFFDQISRGSNFISVSGRMNQFRLWNAPVSIQTTARVYLSQDYAVTWGPQANKGRKLSDYNLLRTRIGWEKLGRLEVQWTVGARLFNGQSFDVIWQAKTRKNMESVAVPWFIKFHHGPLNTLANYSQTQDSLGFGWRFSYFKQQDDESMADQIGK